MIGPAGGIRPARASDLPVLQEIERAAGSLFLPLGMDLDAEDDPPTIATPAEYQREGRARVRTDQDDRPVAYLLADVVDGCAHLEQVSAHPDRARQRLGQELLEHLTTWARERRLPATTLTTYVDVTWNGPQHRHPPDDTAATCRPPALRSRCRKDPAAPQASHARRGPLQQGRIRPRAPSG
jgi:GNAT superfamily N-acetyltransferase